MSETRICANCGEEHSIDQMFEVEVTTVPSGSTRKTPSRTIPTHSATTALMSITSAARTATVLFIVTARIGIMTTTPTAHPAGMSIVTLYTSTVTRRTLFSTAKVCVISALNSKSTTAARLTATRRSSLTSRTPTPKTCTSRRTAAWMKAWNLSLIR